MDSFACRYCGTGMVVQRRGGTVGLKSIEEAIGRMANKLESLIREKKTVADS
jgi:hypothetical protein